MINNKQEEEYNIYSPTALNNFGKFGVPRPVTGSQPATAGNPFVLHPGLSPVVTSFNADAPVEYKNGLRKPSGDLPAAINWSFNSAMTLAKIGLAQLVPSTVPNWPPTTISTSTPRFVIVRKQVNRWKVETIYLEQKRQDRRVRSC